MVLVAGVMLMMVSCENNNDSPATEGKGTVVVKIGDSPFPASLVDKVMVTVDKIEIHAVDSVHMSESTSGFLLLSDKVQEFDLLKLRNGLTTDLVEIEVGVGAYDMLRMHVVSSKVILKDGTEFNLKIPSGSTSGLKIKLEPELVVESGVVNEILVDFDLSKSFVCQGNHKIPNGIKGFIFKPVLRAMWESHSGSIEGTVGEDESTPLAEANVAVIKADTVFSSALTDDQGHYKLIGLPAGSYTLSCYKDGHDSISVDPVVVKAGEKTVQDFVVAKVDVSVVLNP